jgi:hypothetical protein
VIDPSTVHGHRVALFLVRVGDEMDGHDEADAFHLVRGIARWQGGELWVDGIVDDDSPVTDGTLVVDRAWLPRMVPVTPEMVSEVPQLGDAEFLVSVPYRQARLN